MRSQSYQHFEGIIETDRWFGPIFSNLRLTRTHAPIEFESDFPFLQVQPVHQSVYGNAVEAFDVVPDLAELTPEDWDAYRATVVAPNVVPVRKLGGYAVNVRKRRKQSDVG
jgi:hypothetical protein